MAYRYTPQLGYPLSTHKVNDDPFGKHVYIKGIDWGIHVGDDITVPARTPVHAIGRGKVVYAALHPGSKEKGNWGNIVIIAHKNPRTKKVFFSVYGHATNVKVKKGEAVQMGQKIAVIAPSHTPQNGWWPAHLHFGIYIGPWQGEVLPGYYRADQKRTKLKYWRAPMQFIQVYK